MLLEDKISPYHYNNLKRVCADFPKKLDNLTKLDNYWIYGPPGTGKTT